MASQKFKVSLVIASIIALGLASLSFFIVSPQVSQNSDLSETAGLEISSLEIDFGDGRIQNFEIRPDGVRNLFQLTEDILKASNILFKFQTYSGLGQLVTQIADKKNGEDGKYWQFWVNDKYSTVGAFSYKIKVGDKVKWKFTNERE